MSEQYQRPIRVADGGELENVLASHDRVLVEFYTDGCGICQSMEPVLSGVARSADVAVVTMNPRNDPPLVEEYDVRSVPKLLYFEDGDLVDTREDGFVPADDLVAFVGE